MPGARYRPASGAASANTPAFAPELYVRWIRQIRRFKTPAVSERFPVMTGTYQTCVLEGALEHLAGRPRVLSRNPIESPILGSPACSPSPSSPPANRRTRAISRGQLCLACPACGSCRPRRRYRRQRIGAPPPVAARVRQGHHDRPGPATGRLMSPIAPDLADEPDPVIGPRGVPSRRRPNSVTCASRPSALARPCVSFKFHHDLGHTTPRP